MNKLRIIFSALLVSSLFLFNSCSDEDDNPFIGTWTNSYWDITMIFKSDMTGVSKGDPDDTFTYSYTDTQITFTYDGETTSDAVDYTISGSSLTLNDSGFAIVLTKQ